MKFKTIKSIAVAILFLMVANSSAQEKIAVPLSNPNSSGVLQIGIVSGAITITGYNGKEVVVVGTRRVGKKRKSKPNKYGLKKISNNSMEFSVEEYDNTVKVETTPMGTIDFDIKVPVNFSLKVSTVNRGFIQISNIKGAIEVSNVNGKITLKDITGSVSADTVNGDIVANLLKVTPNTAMAFSSLNGILDVTFPKSMKADLKLKSDRGEIFTDFDLKSKPQKAKVTKGRASKGGVYKVKVENWITGSINGGGPEISFKTFNGDIILRSK
ncbi:MAG: hypothetical protein JKY44_02375 [Flavobacteriaceae bacterium]|nr:hypothetical protein [Flavobacteriaceae bacterium]